MTESKGSLPKRAFWTDEQIDSLRALYPNYTTEDVAFVVGHSIRSTYQKARSLGVKKSTEFLASGRAGRLDGVRGGATRFQKGQKAWNAGLRGVVGVQEACRKTQFKAGYRGGKAAELYQPIGTERVSKDGYLERKVNDDMPLQKRWRAVHLVDWEAANGPLPAGHAVAFKDGNKRNTALENLELVSRAELMRRNTRHRLPQELNEVIQLRAVLTRHINNRSKQDGA